MIPSCDHTGIPAGFEGFLHFTSSTTSGSASWMSLRISASFSPRQSVVFLSIRAGKYLQDLSIDLDALIACQLRDLNQVTTSILQLGDGRAGHWGRWHCELGAAGFDSFVVAFDVVGEEHDRGLILLK